MTRLKNSCGFSVVEVLLILVVVCILGFTGWFVYHSRQVANKDYSSQSVTQTSSTQKSATSSTGDAKAKAMATWSDFSDTTIGLKFRYPSDWGQAKLLTMNRTPSDPSGNYYKVSFGNSVYISIDTKASLRDYKITFADLKSDNIKYASSRHVFVNGETVVGAVVPSNGNQDAEIYAARSINLSKVDVSDILLTDVRKYGGSCSQDTYATCYTTDELNSYQWLLESASSL